MKILKKISVYVTSVCVLLLGMTPTLFAANWGGILSVENDLLRPLLQANEQGEAHIDLGINSDVTIEENLRNLFFPSSEGSNTIWRAIRIISVGVLVVFVVWTGASFLLYGTNDENELAAARRSLIYIIYGAALIFLVTWVLGTALDLGAVKGIEGEGSLVNAVENNFFIVILSFLKAAAFFAAIIMFVWYGYQMMMAFDQEDKIKAARTGIINVILALVFIKIIDYLYFIAQSGDFTSGAVDFIVSASRFVAYIAGFLILLAIIYAGYLMIVSRGDDGNLDRAKNILRGVFVVSLIIMLFMLIVYQVFNDLV